MRNIGIKVGNSVVMFPPTAAQLLGHLGEAYVCAEEWHDGRTRWIRKDNPPEVVFLDTSVFTPEPEPMEQLRREKEAATSNWLAYYHKNEELKKELKAAQEKLAKLQEAVKE